MLCLFRYIPRFRSIEKSHRFIIIPLSALSPIFRGPHHMSFDDYPSPWAHGELTVSSRWPRWSRLRGPMITAQSRLGKVTAQSRLSHSSVTARSQLSHGEVTAQSRHLQYDHGSVTARLQLNHGPGHGSVRAGCDHFGHRELTVNSP